ncbi:MAG: D-alanyl-D-alanine carboxypeptidase/D-alanyl-D-alanine-endopeptidase [Gemmatimonadales bacterium]
MSRWLVALLLAGAAPCFSPGARAQTPLPHVRVVRARTPAACRSRRATLAWRLNCLLDAPPFDRALWGVAIADRRGTVVFERNGDRLFVPASTVKLVVAAVAAALLPGDYRFRTSVYAAGPVDSGIVHGDLVLYGRGDPALSARYSPTETAAFDELADSLKARGISRVAGDLVGDASWFDSAATHPSWQAYDLNWWYAAPVTALAFNENSVDFLVAPAAIGQPPEIRLRPDLSVVQFTNRARTVSADSERTLDFFRQPGTNVVWAQGDLPADAPPDTEFFAIHDAPAYAATAFRRSLEAHGITVDGQLRTTFDSTAYAAARAAPPLAEHLSPPLPEILQPILATSQNWFAEMLLKTLGRELRGQGSWPAGLDVERRFLIDSLGVDSTMFDLVDGSGLSAWNLVAPRAFVQILTRMRRLARARAFLDALPVAGESGTLKGRFADARLVGRVRAKTGSINRVNSLAGYLELARGRTWIFSIQLNNHTATTREALARIDAIVTALAR